MLAPLDVVRLPAGLPEHGVLPNSRAVILDVYETPHLAYEIEVLDREGRTLFTGAVEPACVERLQLS